MATHHILTLPFDAEAGGFRDEALTELAATHEILSLVPAFFDHGGRPFWTVFAECIARAPAASEAPASSDAPATLDAQARAVYDRLVSWRRARAKTEGVPPYIILTNAQARAAVVARPSTLAGLRGIRGIGERKAAKYGRAILEILHGPDPTSRAGEQPDATPERGGAADPPALDGPAPVAAAADGPLPAQGAVHPDDADRQPGAGRPRRPDDRGVHGAGEARGAGPDEPATDAPAGDAADGA